MQQVVITDYMEPPATIETDELAGIAEVKCLMAKTENDLLGTLKDADGILLCHEVSITANVIEGLDRCKAIVRVGVGFDNVDLKAAGERGIYACNVPDYGVDEVADHAIAMMLACNRGVIIAERRLRSGLQPWDMRAVPPVLRLSEATMGIVGLGRIGGATALRAKALKMKVIAYDPYVRPGTDKVLGVELVSFEDLLKSSDVVSLHTPLTEETHHLIDADALRKMKPTSILVNTARGAVVDTDALAKALEDQHISGAGIDVLPKEPVSPSMPLVRLWQQEHNPPLNLILTPHTAFYSEAGLIEMRQKAARELGRVLKGENPQNCVNLEYLQSPRAERQP